MPQFFRCHGCTDRYPGCHAKCKKYKEDRAKWEEYKAAEKTKNDIDQYAISLSAKRQNDYSIKKKNMKGYGRCMDN